MSDVLAIEGGAPVRSTPMPRWPYVPEEDIAVVAEVLRSGKINYWTGDAGRHFEKEFAAFSGTEYAIALSNGTVALELPLKACGVGPGDEVVVTPRSFIASASCIVAVGATPVFADLDPVTQTITAETIRKVLTPRTKAVIAVHLAGWPCDMDPIMELAAEKGLVVIEDCAQCHGAKYKGRPVGSIGHVAAWSFCQDKIMTTGGEGGMITTNDRDIWNYCWSFKDHGKSWDLVYNTKHKPGFQWLHASFGTNMRLSEVQSALGRQALKRLPEEIEKRRAHGHRLTEALKQFPCIRVTEPPPEIFHAYYKYYCFVRPEHLAANWSRDQIMQAVTAEGVACLSGSCGEMYLEKAFTEEMRPRERLPIAKELGETSLMTLVHPTISERDMDDVIQAFTKVLTRACA
jgi:dTDP-4-amino-4,6-dideoxygalactose transaminase